MKTVINHKGTIEKIDGNHITVRIMQASGCAACGMADHCNASESKEKRIDVIDDHAAEYEIGQHVRVTADLKSGYRAVLLGFGAPLLVMACALFGVLVATGNETLSALCGMGALVVYYVALYLVRDKLGKRFTFTIE
ncbi:SoxR reducing system RseC family protein [Hallella colorans]|uniref:SoxR reducing system RseC family protein n=1 Tax=Hallella colorans TaxID=1703337 RepID=UPI0023F0203B|nr:SoxR reducing system RseC family protein [Hallella colorans]